MHNISNIWNFGENEEMLLYKRKHLSHAKHENTVKTIINRWLWMNKNLVTRTKQEHWNMNQRQAKLDNPSWPFSWSEHNKKKFDYSSHFIRLITFPRYKLMKKNTRFQGVLLWKFRLPVQDPIFPSQAGARICKPERAKTRTPCVSEKSSSGITYANLLSK